MDEMPSPTKEAPPAGSAPQLANPMAVGKALPAGSHRANRRRWLIRGSLVMLLLAAVVLIGVPWISQVLSTVSTDDAYVNGHVTFVASRVPGQVLQVLVDDNNRVHKGDLLVQLDKEPYQVQVAVKRAAVGTAQADLAAARAQVRALESQARSYRWALQHTIEQVDNQVAMLRANVATLQSQEASLELAQADFDRDQKLIVTNAISREDFDQKRAAMLVAKAQVKQALENVYQIRVSLGLPIKPSRGNDLTDVPPDLDQTFSTVRQAQGNLIEIVAQIGVLPSSYELTPKQMLEEFLKRDPQGNLDRIFGRLVDEAPAVKQAQGKLLQAQRDLDQANLNLRYCDVWAEIDGVVTRRNVNPGNNVQAGQSLMAVRSLREIWIDANFKETQLADLRIGQQADVYVDLYGGRHVFRGRISGFTMGTGSTLAILPAENATGNFVKVVQRLPVRIELSDYDPDRVPLFIGLSVTPYVALDKPPTGPGAGQVLQSFLPAVPTGMAESQGAETKR
jgi:membrane fusion protein (multidrug efflux system)